MNTTRKRIPCGFVASSAWPVDCYPDYCPPKHQEIEYDVERDGVLDEKVVFDPLESVLDRQIQSITKTPYEDRGSRIHPIMRGEEGHHLNPFHQMVRRALIPVNNNAQCKLRLQQFKELPEYPELIARLDE